VSDQPQNYATHKRYLPWFHFFALPVLLVNAVVAVVAAFRAGTLAAAGQALVALALAMGVLLSRIMALTTQTRLIRLEERLRLARLLPAAQQSALPQLTTDQLVGLRFASDGEVPDLVRRITAGELKTREEIKRSIQSWRADEMRV
jgi:hypothetical protein